MSAAALRAATGKGLLDGWLGGCRAGGCRCRWLAEPPVLVPPERAYESSRPTTGCRRRHARRARQCWLCACAGDGAARKAHAVVVVVVVVAKTTTPARLVGGVSATASSRQSNKLPPLRSLNPFHSLQPASQPLNSKSLLAKLLSLLFHYYC